MRWFTKYNGMVLLNAVFICVLISFWETEAKCKNGMDKNIYYVLLQVLLVTYFFLIGVLFNIILLQIL